MEAFQFFMPVKLYFGRDCIEKNKECFKSLGKKAMIFTGKHSARNNGSLMDVTKALDDMSISYLVFDEVEENPTLETIGRASERGIRENVDFVIGIGGGSPMDAAKSAACLMANADMDMDALYESKKLTHLPLVEVPTTAGTGSETTPYSILTLHEKKTKASTKQLVFAEMAFLDANYMMELSDVVTTNTAVDALSHLVEGYMAVKANFMSEKIAEAGFAAFKECLEAVRTKKYDIEVREKLLLSSTIGGMVISQSGTSLPHLMGYALTYNRNLPHGRANGLLMKAYLSLFKNEQSLKKINRFLDILGFASLDALGDYLDEVFGDKEVFTDQEIEKFTKLSVQNKLKLATFPEKVEEEDIRNIYIKSLK